jgi:hypothetical protein
MPPSRLILLLLSVIGAAALTVFLAVTLAATLDTGTPNVTGSGLWLLILPVAAVIMWRLRARHPRGS